MGNRLGRAIFLLICLAIDSQTIRSQEQNSTSCQADCMTQDDGGASCISIPDPHCSGFYPPSSNQVTKATDPLVRVTSLTVNPKAYSSLYIVTLQWISPQESSGDSTRGYHVRWQAHGGTDSGTPPSPTAVSGTTNCQSLDFVHSQNTSALIPVIRWCYKTNHPGRLHNVTIASQNSNASLTFTINMPLNLTVIEEPSSGSEWQTPVGIGVDVVSRCINTVIQRAPPELNITSYKLTLVSTKDGMTVMEQELPRENASHSFEDVKDQGSYVIRVEPCGTGCVPRCQRSESAVFYLPRPTGGRPAARPGGFPTTTPPSTAPAPAATPRPPSPTTTPTDRRLHRTTAATDPSVMVKPAVNQTEYTKSRNIILGTVFGVVFLAIVAAVCFCIYKRTRNAPTGSFPLQPFGPRRESNSSIIADDPLKSQPLVLLLYSYDCPVHEVVVTTFAYFLKEVANCEVIFDIWDQHNIQEQGVYAWLVEKIDIANYIIFICSTGARFKCARNRQFRMKHDRTLPDVFTWGVDHVAEKIRTSANSAEAQTRYVSAYFDYACKSDIPPKLEVRPKFCLMKELHGLYGHLHGTKVSASAAAKLGLTIDTYSKTEEGRQLQDALIDAKHFFKDNPNWLGQTLEPITPVLAAGRELPAVPDTPEEPPRPPQRLPPAVNSPPSTTTTTTTTAGGLPGHGVVNGGDLLLEERKKKRLREVEGTMQRVPLGGHKKEEGGSFRSAGPVSPVHGPPSEGGGSSVTSLSPLMSPALPAKAPPASTQPGHTYAPSSGASSREIVDVDEDTDADDTSQMQRDIDFIQNFDVHHSWEPSAAQNETTGHFYVDLELDIGSYTPPEDFLSLASLEEEANLATKAHPKSSSSSSSSPLHQKSVPAQSTNPTAPSSATRQALKDGSPSRRRPRASPASAVKGSHGGVTSPLRPSPAQSASSLNSANMVHCNNHHSPSSSSSNGNGVPLAAAAHAALSGIRSPHTSAGQSPPSYNSPPVSTGPMSQPTSPTSKLGSVFASVPHINNMTGSTASLHAPSSAPAVPVANNGSSAWNFSGPALSGLQQQPEQEQKQLQQTVSQQQQLQQVPQQQQQQSSPPHGSIPVYPIAASSISSHSKSEPSSQTDGPPTGTNGHFAVDLEAINSPGKSNSKPPDQGLTHSTPAEGVRLSSAEFPC